MKYYLAIVLLLFIAATATTVRGQDPTPANAPQSNSENNPTAPPMTENDRIPFLANQTSGTTAPPDQSNGGLIVKMFGSLLVVIGLLFGGVWAVKRFAPGLFPRSATVDAQLALIESISIGPGRTIATVRFGERLLLVGSTPQSISLLAEDDAPLPVTRSVAELLDEEGDFQTVYARASRMMADESSAEGGRS